MVDTHKESNVFGSGSDFLPLVMVRNFKAVKANGIAFRTETGSTGDGLLTYKRRKNAKVAEAGKIPDESSMKHERDQAQCFQNGSHPRTALFNDCSLKHQRNIILEQISQSLDNEGGLKKCIQNVLVFHPGSGGRTSVKESVHSCEDCSKCTSQTGTLNGLHKAAEGNVGMTSNGSEHCTVTELCERTFSDIITSEKFAQLCSLLHENFQGLKAEKIFNLNHINSRMKENAYENSPFLFQTDIQEVWTKLEKVGSDITALAKCLSDKAASSFSKQVGNFARGIPQDSKFEFVAQESDIHAKPEQTDANALDEAPKCRRCRQKADGRNGLVCDSCEGMYHISCIEPQIKEIPTRSWYCADCTANEIDSPHENCVACEKLNTSKSSPLNITSKQDEFLDGETTEELGESSNKYTHCKVCRTEVTNDEEYRSCGHTFCAHLYHVKCLTSNELTFYASCWYCPSCLCRACLTDRDDGKLVLCDGCDHAYHTYCMDPPRTAVPEGNWFCTKCESGIERIREARRTYTSRKRGLDGKVKGKTGSKKSGGVDMLLNAAKTLNYEDNFVGLKTD